MTPSSFHRQRKNPGSHILLLLRSSGVQIAGAAIALEPCGQLGELDGLGELDAMPGNVECLPRPLLGTNLTLSNLELANLLHGDFQMAAEALA